jgi:hypothetical protein
MAFKFIESAPGDTYFSAFLEGPAFSTTDGVLASHSNHICEVRTDRQHEIIPMSSHEWRSSCYVNCTRVQFS